VRDEQTAEWPINEVVAVTGTTSRTLRHYGALGILPPSRIAPSGYRYYDRDALVRLQRILLLRELGLGLPAIARVLDRETDMASVLEAHLGLLHDEQERLARQRDAVQRTLDAIREGKGLEMADMFDGFDHTRYKEEVERRWGEDSYIRGARWWESKTPAERDEWRRDQAERNRAWSELAGTGAAPDGSEAQALAARHVRWLIGIPGTPASSGDPAALKEYVLGLADLYVTDARFAANYGGQDGAGFVRDALRHYAATSL
jgi:DNA-binding transcriptional MerR regulator